MSSPVMHFEYAARDRAQLAGFYSQLFGWKATDYPGFDYTIVQTANGAGIDGGIGPVGAAGAGVIVYAQVDSVESVLARAVLLGATIVLEPFDVPGVGRFAVFADPEGNRTGVWKVGSVLK
jgi:uncharacterized protein